MVKIEPNYGLTRLHGWLRTISPTKVGRGRPPAMMSHGCFKSFSHAALDELPKSGGLSAG